MSFGKRYQIEATRHEISKVKGKTPASPDVEPEEFAGRARLTFPIPDQWPYWATAIGACVLIPLTVTLLEDVRAELNPVAYLQSCAQRVQTGKTPCDLKQVERAFLKAMRAPEMQAMMAEGQRQFAKSITDGMKAAELNFNEEWRRTQGAAQRQADALQEEAERSSRAVQRQIDYAQQDMIAAQRKMQYEVERNQRDTCASLRQMNADRSLLTASGC